MNLDRFGYLDIESLPNYFIEINRIPLLTRDEEQKFTERYSACCQQLKKANPNHRLCPYCEEAKNKLVASNLRFVVSLAKSHQNGKFTLPELINQGNIGLQNAVDQYDRNAGHQFISYGLWWSKQFILKAVSERPEMIHIPKRSS